MVFNSSDPQRRKWSACAVILVIGVGALLRVVNLNAQSYWYDEVFSWNTSASSFSEMMSSLIEDFVHPPFHYLVLHAWLALGWPDAAAGGRYLMAAFGIACLPVQYLLGREVYGRGEAWIGTLLLAISQLAIAYSQEVRPYAQLMLFSMLTVLLYIMAINRRSMMLFGAAALLASLALLTHYYAVLTLAALASWHVLFARDRVPISWVIMAGAVVAAAFTPWLLSGVVEAALSSSKTVREAQPAWFTVDWSTIFENLAAFGNAREQNVVAPGWSTWRILASSMLFCGPALLVARGPWVAMLRSVVLRDLAVLVAIVGGGLLTHAGPWTLVAALTAACCMALDRPFLLLARRWRVIGTIVVVSAAAVLAIGYDAPPPAAFVLGAMAATPLRFAMSESRGDEWPADVLLILLMAIPIGSLLIFGKLGVQYDIRYILPALPAFYLLTARGLYLITNASVRWSWIVVTAIYSLLGVHTALYTPSKENYRDALKLVHDRYSVGECVAFQPRSALPGQWKLYGYDDVSVRLADRQELSTGAPACKAIWLVIYERIPQAVETGKAVEASLSGFREGREAGSFHWVRVVYFGDLKEDIARSKRRLSSPAAKPFAELAARRVRQPATAPLCAAEAGRRRWI